MRAFDVQVCQPTNADICTIGACCPAGKKWDCDTNSCIVDEFLCPAGEVKTPTPESPLCLLHVVSKTGGTDFSFSAYEHTLGSCTLASTTTHDIPAKTIAPVGGSTSLTVSSTLQSISATTTSSFLLSTDVSPLLTCPTGSVAHCLPGDSVGNFSCGCYLTTLPVPAAIVEPEYTCEVVGCAE